MANISVNKSLGEGEWIDNRGIKRSIYEAFEENELVVMSLDDLKNLQTECQCRLQGWLRARLSLILKEKKVDTALREALQVSGFTITYQYSDLSGNTVVKYGDKVVFSKDVALLGEHWKELNDIYLECVKVKNERIEMEQMVEKHNLIKQMLGLS